MTLKPGIRERTHREEPDFSNPDFSKPPCPKCKAWHTGDCGFDPEAPCSLCGKPLKALSYGGPTICPWCDMGADRDGPSKPQPKDKP